MAIHILNLGMQGMERAELLCKVGGYAESQGDPGMGTASLAEAGAGNRTHQQPQHCEGMNQGQGPVEGAVRSKK